MIPTKKPSFLFIIPLFNTINYYMFSQRAEIF